MVIVRWTVAEEVLRALIIANTRHSKRAGAQFNKSKTKTITITTYHEVKRTMAMDLIADMERAAPSLAHRRLSLSCRLKIPGYVRILWVFKKLISS